MERTYFPGRGYWNAFGGIVSLWTMFIGMFIFSTQLEGKPAELHWHTSASLWWSIAATVISLLVAAVYGVLVYRRKHLVICEDEVRSYGALLVRDIRFADVIEAEWLWLRIKDRERYYRLRLHTETKRLTIHFDSFVQVGAENELIELFRHRLGPHVRQIWGPSPRVRSRQEIVQAVREGRASYWSPPVCTIKSISRMLLVSTVLSGVVGAVIGSLFHQVPGVAELWAGAAGSGQVGNLLQIRIPDAVERVWSGSLPLDWGISWGILGLIAGILFLFPLWFLEWTSRKWRMFKARK